MEELYPYSLNPTGHFHLNCIPVCGTEERVEFFYKYKRKSEDLFVGEMKVSDLGYVFHDFTPSITNYFLGKQYLDSSIHLDIRKRLFPKLCWLTEDLLQDGFRFPLNVHYNPRIEKNVVHPGSIRNKILKLFKSDSSIKALYFNTGGVEFDFMNSMNIFTKEELLSYKKNLEIELVADHGSIIPHLNLDGNSVKDTSLVWQSVLKEKILSKDFKIFYDTELEFFKPWYTAKEHARIEIYTDFKKRDIISDVKAKIAILAVLGKSYECPSFKIICKD